MTERVLPDISRDLSDMRREYKSEPLVIENLDSNPFREFSKWMESAINVEDGEANAMVLSTADAQGRPSSRIVLLKSYSWDGFIFFTNYNSKKGRDISENNRVALLLFWPKSFRQIRVEGIASKIDPRLSDRYFLSRPVESRASSLLSKQSEVLESREDFENSVINLTRDNTNIERPSHWGGYSVRPLSFEFWQGGTGRSHDRFLYTIEREEWKIERLYP